MSYSNPRVELADTMIEIITKMSDGNPGAVTVLIQLVAHSGKIDPDNCLGAAGPIISLDIIDIYGSHIWMFYKDIAKEDLTTMVGLLRAVQLGYLSESTLKEAIINYGSMTQETIDELMVKVREFLPAFGQV